MYKNHTGRGNVKSVLLSTHTLATSPRESRAFVLNYLNFLFLYTVPLVLLFTVTYDDYLPLYHFFLPSQDFLTVTDIAKYKFTVHKSVKGNQTKQQLLHFSL